MSFDLDIGVASGPGGRDRMEDFVVARRPEPQDDAFGFIGAIADGVSTGGEGRMAAQTSVITLVEDYFGAPATWDTTVVLDRVIDKTVAVSASLTRQASDFMAENRRWMWALVLLPIAGGVWVWRARRSAYDEAGLPRGPKL